MSLRDRFPQAARFDRDEDLDGVDDEPSSAYIRAAFLDSVRRFAPDARLDAFADIKLGGLVFDRGVFERHAADIFVKLQNEIDSVTDESERPDVQIGFSRIGQGSVVMHLNPVPPRPPEPDQMPISVPSALEQALLRILDLHDAFEAGDDGLVTTRAKGELATRARQLVESLDEAGARLEVDLARSDGSRRQSRLTDVGRENARLFFERTPLSKNVTLAGYLRTTSTTGHVEITTGNKVIEIVEVPIEIAKSLTWDTLYRIRVRRTTKAAKAGSKPKVTHQFIRMVQHDEVLTDDD